MIGWILIVAGVVMSAVCLYLALTKKRRDKQKEEEALARLAPGGGY